MHPFFLSCSSLRSHCGGGRSPYSFVAHSSSFFFSFLRVEGHEAQSIQEMENQWLSATNWSAILGSVHGAGTDGMRGNETSTSKMASCVAQISFWTLWTLMKDNRCWICLRATAAPRGGTNGWHVLWMTFQQWTTTSCPSWYFGSIQNANTIQP